MKLKFWGSCGSIPAPLSAAQVRAKVFTALKATRGHELKSESDILRFVDETLPFSVSRTYGGNTSCVEVGVAGDPAVYFLDAGSGLRDYSESFLTRDQAARPDTFHFFISHLHWDHIQGFPFFSPAYLPGNTIVIHGFHPDLEGAFVEQMNLPCFPVPWKTLKSKINFVVYEEGASFDYGRLHIRTIPQYHPGKSYGYRFEVNGRAFVYSTDSEHKDEAHCDDYPFIEFFRNADVLVFDAQYNLHDATYNKADWGHSSNIMGVELASRSRAKHLVIFHHEPGNSDAELDEFLFHTQTYSDIYYAETYPGNDQPKYPQKISLAFDGLILEI